MLKRDCSPSNFVLASLINVLLSYFWSVGSAASTAIGDLPGGVLYFGSNSSLNIYE
jgi:hypothetical protein